jgi:hypothetical protein
VSNESLKQLAAPFAAASTEWRVIEILGDEAKVRPQLRFERVRQRLDETLGVAGWSSRYRAMGEAVACELSVGNVTKSALAESTHVDKSTASQDAFVYAAELFGMLPPMNRFETYQVDYDPEAKAPLFDPEVETNNLEPGELEPEVRPDGMRPSSGTAADPAPEVTEAPAKSAGQQAIDKLVERLEGEGKGKDVAKLVIKYGGYGQNPDAARELYSKLRALLVGEGAS